MRLLPALLNNWGVPPDWLTILFGIGVLQVLLTAPPGIVDQFPQDMAGWGALIAGLFGRSAHRRGSARVIEIDGPDRPLRRRHAARRHDRQVRRGHLRADRPQRRRQDDLLQRAQRVRARRPPGTVARVRRRPAVDGPLPPRPLGRCGARSRPSRRSRSCRSTTTWRWSTSTRRAASGVAQRGRARRDRVRRARRRARREGRARSAPRERRLVEVARAVVGKPRVVLLDEPAAGLPDEETEHLGRGDPADPGAHRRARDPRRPRHEPRVGLLRDDRGARLRQADRVRPDRGGAARRARDARLPRHRRRSA